MLRTAWQVGFWWVLEGGPDFGNRGSRREGHSGNGSSGWGLIKVSLF